MCSGTGMLTLCCLMHECKYVVSIEKDPDAIAVANLNLQNIIDEQIFRSRVQIINSDLLESHFNFKFDTVIMNPPFGTKSNSGIDGKLLCKAFTLADCVYSIHKTSTEEVRISLNFSSNFFSPLSSYRNWRRRTDLAVKYWHI